MFPNEGTNEGSMSNDDRIRPSGDLIFSSTGQVSRRKFNELDLEKAITTNKTKYGSSLVRDKLAARRAAAIKVDKKFKSI